MAAPQVHHLFHHPIADHSFSADRNILAVAKDSALELYEKAGSAFKLKDELKGHDKTITGVDVAPSSGRIVTCSQGPYISRSGQIGGPSNPASRSKCSSMGTISHRLQAHLGVATYCSSSHLRALVAF